MLDPKEIDAFFDANALRKKIKTSKITDHTRKVMLVKLTLPIIAGLLAITLMVFPSLKDDIKDFSLDFNIKKAILSTLISKIQPNTLPTKKIE